jgi:hypothetical protein
MNNVNRFKIPSGNLHPSEVQDTNTNNEYVKNQRTILAVQNERSQALATTDLPHLQSPGKYKFTEDDTRFAGSNTKSLFKNLYGETPLTFLFFSGKNIDNIQNLIRFVVHKEIGQSIDNQDPTELMIIMRSIFLEYSRHPKLIDDTMPQEMKNALFSQYTSEVDRLNQLVVNETVPRVISGLQQYLDYLRDASTQPIPHQLPQSMSSAGTKTYRSVTSVLTGSVI